MSIGDMGLGGMTVGRMRGGNILRRGQSSLLWRVALAVFLACFITLLLIYFSRARLHESSWDGSLNKYVARASWHLNGLNTEAEAADFGLGFSRVFLVFPYWNGARPSRVEVWSNDGRRIWHDPRFASPALGDSTPGQVGKIVIAGETYRVLRHDGARWSLRVAVHIHSIPSAMFSYLESPFIRERIAYSFLILLLPLWLIVRHGLAPLRTLAAQLTQRAADDLAALGLASRYRELAPVLSALDALLLQLRNKVAREHAFLQDAAHELRTPIAVISAQTDILANARTLAERDEAEQHITHAMARANHLLAQLADLTRLDSAAEPAPEWLDLVRLLQQDLAAASSQARTRQMTIDAALTADLWCHVEKNTFQSVLLNFLSNALRYGERGGRIALTLAREAGGVRLSVADDGPGIDPAQRERIFERFYRGVGHDVSGAGLGLAIVQQAALRLQARLELGPGLKGRGCCFSLWMPLPEVSLPHVPQPEVPVVVEAATEAVVEAAVDEMAAGKQAARHSPRVPRAGRALGAPWPAISGRLAGALAPSLLRRLIGLVLLANAVVWCTVFVQQVFQDVLLNTSSRATQLRDAGRVLQQSATAQQARLFAAAFMPAYEWYVGNPALQDRPNLLELWSPDGQRLFANRKGVSTDYGALQGVAGRMVPLLLHDKAYHLFRSDGSDQGRPAPGEPGWSLRLAVPQAFGSPWPYLAGVASDPGFWWQIGLSMVLLLLVLRLALGRALAPLFALSQRLAERGANDLSPLGFAAPYRELAPIVEALERLLQQLREKIAREQRFIQDVGQKLRQPLAVMATQSRILAASGPARQQAEQQIDQAVAQASHLIARLLQMARIDGLHAAPPESLDLAQLLEAELASRVPQAVARGIELSLDAPPSLCLLLERHAFDAIVHNLLDNALRYGRVDGCVALQLQQHGENLMLSVADDGPGIAEAERERVFERFYRGAAAPGDAVGGLGAGLGLAIVRQAARRLGGTVQLTRGLHGTGCRFIVILPVPGH
jgi:signal transduction histidine kinase